MKITYNLEKEDVIKCRWYFTQVKPSKPNQRIRQFILIFITTVGLIQIFFTWSQHSWLYHILYLVILVGSYWILMKCLSWLINLYLVRQNIPKSGLICQHTITLTETKLIEKTDVNESHQNWQGISKIDENEDYLFIFTGPEQAHIIPKIAFFDAEAYQIFYAFVKRCYDQYHHSSMT